MRFNSRLPFLSLLLISAACSPEADGTVDDGAESGGSGGTNAGTGGTNPSSGGTSGSANTGGASTSTGGIPSTGTGGLTSSGGQQFSTGGLPGAGGFPGNATGGRFGGNTGGQGDGGGPPGNTGGAGSGGETQSTGGSASGGGSPVELDCDASVPSSGEVHHTGNGVGGEGNLAWEIWSNTGNGDLVTYGDVPAFSAVWNEAGGYLGRMGYEWGGFMSNPKPYEEYGTITAQFASKKTGTAGQYSYVGMYGWSNDPCIEWYVVDDSFNNMPINPGTTTKQGEVEIDGGTYIMYTRPTTGTGGSRCEGVNSWNQYYSVRTTARACGVISLTEHFDAWKALNMPMGVLLEAKIIAEVGGGTGRVDFAVANVVATSP